MYLYRELDLLGVSKEGQMTEAEMKKMNLAIAKQAGAISWEEFFRRWEAITKEEERQKEKK